MDKSIVSPFLTHGVYHQITTPEMYFREHAYVDVPVRISWQHLSANSDVAVVMARCLATGSSSSTGGLH